MNKKHTPGPWHIGMKPGPMIYGTLGEQVCDMRDEVIDNAENVANARLIAAAPALLAMLERATEVMSNAKCIWTRTNPVVTDARALIATIKGE